MPNLKLSNVKIYLNLDMQGQIFQVYVIRKAIKYIQRGAFDQCLHIFLLSMTMGDLLLTSNIPI